MPGSGASPSPLRPRTHLALAMDTSLPFEKGDEPTTSLSRRTVMMMPLAGVACASATSALGTYAAPTAQRARPCTVNTLIVVNGSAIRLELQPRSSLLDVLREQLGLTGTKKGCDHGQCGACTVHIDGRRIASCLTLGVTADGRAVTTIEGIESPTGALHPMQQAFIDHDALQCGYCTPGQVMAAIACVREGHAKTDAQIREYMSGNLCRCGAYAGILAAIRETAPLMLRRGGDRHA
jgi:xanthine dehydrogenase YagT iron-sulfur-binding subunit